jgi:hypothetical protein
MYGMQILTLIENLKHANKPNPCLLARNTKFIQKSFVFSYFHVVKVNSKECLHCMANKCMLKMSET